MDDTTISTDEPTILKRTRRPGRPRKNPLQLPLIKEGIVTKAKKRKSFG